MPEPILDQQPVTDIEEYKIFAAMSYMGVLVLVPLFVKKDDPFVLFHVKQGFVILVGFVITFLSMFWITVVSNILFLILFLISVIGLVQALQGRRWKIPVIGGIAEKFNI